MGWTTGGGLGEAVTREVPVGRQWPSLVVALGQGAGRRAVVSLMAKIENL